MITSKNGRRPQKKIKKNKDNLKKMDDDLIFIEMEDDLNKMQF
jgi:hypothetical protein